MILFINAADGKNIFIALAQGDSVIINKTVQAQYKQAEKLLPEIDKLLRLSKKKLNQLKGIVVVTGPGPFTALRIGIITANTLSWALKIPIVGLKLTEFDDNTDLITKGAIKFKKSSSKNIIMPFYGKEPNITKKKNK